ncbi:MAG: hypothetical protein ACREYE_07195 [Gammaproteobacteria bacterium]
MARTMPQRSQPTMKAKDRGCGHQRMRQSHILCLPKGVWRPSVVAESRQKASQRDGLRQWSSLRSFAGGEDGIPVVNFYWRPGVRLRGCAQSLWKKSTALGTSRSGGARNPHVFHYTLRLFVPSLGLAPAGLALRFAPGKTVLRSGGPRLSF